MPEQSINVDSFLTLWLFHPDNNYCSLSYTSHTPHILSRRRWIHDLSALNPWLQQQLLSQQIFTDLMDENRTLDRDSFKTIVKLVFEVPHLYQMIKILPPQYLLVHHGIKKFIASLPLADLCRKQQIMAKQHENSGKYHISASCYYTTAPYPKSVGKQIVTNVTEYIEKIKLHP